MKKQLLITSILAFGMGLAQAQTPAPMQGTSPDPGSKGSSAQASPASPGSGAAAATSSTSADNAVAPQTFKGCLTGSSGNWNLAADNGQTLKLSGADDQLSSFNNQQVNINGTQATDGTIKVASIDKISDSCNNTGQAATSSNMSNQPTSSSTDQSNAAGQSSTSSMNSQSTTQSTTTSSTDQTANTGAAGQSTTSPSSTTPPSSTDQNAASSSGAATSTQGNAAGTTSPTASTSGQNPASTGNPNAGTTGQTSDQSVRHISDMDENQKAGGQQLPQTASPLPLLGLMGLGSLVTGLVARRKK